MSVNLADLKLHVETDLDDAVLTRILTSAQQAVVRAAGSATAETEMHLARNSQWLVLRRRHTAISSVKERRRHSSDEVTLASNDYREVGDYRIIRVEDGDNPAGCWGDEVEVAYTPEIDEDIRDRVTLDLCKVDIEFQAHEREKSGDWEGVQKDWKARRRELLAHVREGRSVFG